MPGAVEDDRQVLEGRRDALTLAILQLQSARIETFASCGQVLLNNKVRVFRLHGLKPGQGVQHIGPLPL
jgi:hypothetical protein